MLSDDGRQHREQGASMRGIFNHIRGLAHAKAFDFFAAMQEIREELAVAISSHFICHLGGTMSGVFVRAPLSRLSAWAEWREVNCGLGIETTTGNLQIWLGRLDLVFSVEPRPTSAEAAK